MKDRLSATSQVDILPPREYNAPLLARGDKRGYTCV
jgi:hypothetical protein